MYSVFTIFYFAVVGDIVFPDYRHVYVVEPQSIEPRRCPVRAESVEQSLHLTRAKYM